jgi:hypothetical protein
MISKAELRRRELAQLLGALKLDKEKLGEKYRRNQLALGNVKAAIIRVKADLAALEPILKEENVPKQIDPALHPRENY